MRDSELKAFATSVNQQIQALLMNFQGSTFQDGSEQKYYLRFLKYLTNLIISVNNIESDYVGFTIVDKINVQAIFFFNIGFESENDQVFKAYQNSEDEKLSAVAEEILGNSIAYFKGLLEDPYIWRSDMIYDFEPEEQKEEQNAVDLEEYIASNIFTEQQTIKMLQSMTQKFIILTDLEI